MALDKESRFANESVGSQFPRMRIPHLDGSSCLHAHTASWSRGVHATVASRKTVEAAVRRETYRDRSHTPTLLARFLHLLVQSRHAHRPGKAPKMRWIWLPPISQGIPYICRPLDNP